MQGTKKLSGVRETDCRDGEGLGTCNILPPAIAKTIFPHHGVSLDRLPRNPSWIGATLSSFGESCSKKLASAKESRNVL